MNLTFGCHCFVLPETLSLLKSHFTHHLAKSYVRKRNLSNSSRRSIEKARSTLTKLPRKSIIRERTEKYFCKQCGLRYEHRGRQITKLWSIDRLLFIQNPLNFSKFISFFNIKVSHLPCYFYMYFVL